jgi:hypothetical protein
MICINPLFKGGSFALGKTGDFLSCIPNNRLMSDKKNSNPALFTKKNYTWMIAGIIVIALGMLLMAGGKSDDPNVFNKKEVYSVTRITIAPVLIVIGFVIEIFAIFRKQK